MFGTSAQRRALISHRGEEMKDFLLLSARQYKRKCFGKSVFIFSLIFGFLFLLFLFFFVFASFLWGLLHSWCSDKSCKHSHCNVLLQSGPDGTFRFIFISYITETRAETATINSLDFFLFVLVHEYILKDINQRKMKKKKKKWNSAIQRQLQFYLYKKTTCQ